MSKIYCGSAKEKRFDNGEVLSVSLNLTEVLNNFVEYGYVSKTGNKMITLKVSRRREVGMYGETHTVEVDTWKPDNKQAPVQNRIESARLQAGTNNIDNNQPPAFPDDIPF